MQILKELDKFDENSNKFQLVDSENQHSNFGIIRAAHEK